MRFLPAGNRQFLCNVRVDLSEQLTNSFGVDITVIDFIKKGQRERIDRPQDIKAFSSMRPFNKSTNLGPKITYQYTEDKMRGVHKENLAFTFLSFFQTWFKLFLKRSLAFGDQPSQASSPFSIGVFSDDEEILERRIFHDESRSVPQ